MGWANARVPKLGRVQKVTTVSVKAVINWVLTGDSLGGYYLLSDF